MEKSEFQVVSFAAMMDKINRSFPGELSKDWQQFIRSEFKLTADQEKAVAEASTRDVERVRDFFVEAEKYVRKGGKLRGEIVKLPAERRTAKAAQELLLHTEGDTITPQLSIVIAHCDPDCRNWGWGPA